jgi:pyruvate,water dikinase
MDELIYSFDTIKEPKHLEIGRKAKALIESKRANFPVPEGIVLSVSFFRQWIDIIKGSDGWKKLLIEPTKERCDDLKAKACGLRFNEIQWQELNTHLKALGSNNLFAVSSSSKKNEGC